MNNKILIGTHHKTGTVLMLTIFTRLSEKIGLKFYNCSREKVDGSDWDILYDSHSHFPGFVPHEAVKGVHVIRDPRMVVVSSALYHMKSSEKWLHVPRKAFSGRTYQQQILSLPSNRDRFIFEMTHTAGTVIKGMEAWTTKGWSWSLDVKLEELMVDIGMDHYFRIFRHLGFDGESLIHALRIAFDASVFGGRKSGSGHIRSARPEHWSEYYDDELSAIFVEKFGNVAERLGYQ
jgi:hypothetical protein